MNIGCGTREIKRHFRCTVLTASARSHTDSSATIHSSCQQVRITALCAPSAVNKRIPRQVLSVRGSPTDSIHFSRLVDVGLSKGSERRNDDVEL